MHVKRLQYYENILTGTLVKVTKVIRPAINTRKKDLCLVKDVSCGRIDDNTGRYILSDSLRRKYVAVYC